MHPIMGRGVAPLFQEAQRGCAGLQFCADWTHFCASEFRLCISPILGELFHFCAPDFGHHHEGGSLFLPEEAQVRSPRTSGRVGTRCFHFCARVTRDRVGAGCTHFYELAVKKR